MNESNEYERFVAWHAKSQALLELKNWGQLHQLTASWLAAVPDSGMAHYYAGWAAIGMGNFDQMRVHARILLESAPNSIHSHEMGCRYWLQRNRLNYALYHAQRMIEIDPEYATGYYFASICAYSPKSVGAAKGYIDHARQLQPNDAEIGEWQLRMQLVTAQTAEEIRQLEKGFFSLLRLDPEQASSHESLGDYYLAEIDDPKRALASYQTALELNPVDVNCQRKFAAAYKRRNLFLRTLFSYEFFLHLIAAIAFKPGKVLLILAILALSPLGLAIIIFWILSTMVLFVPAALTEILFFPDVFVSHQYIRSPIRSDFRRFPLWFRCAFVAIATVLVWVFLFRWIGLSLGRRMLLIGVIIGINFAIQIIILTYQRGRLIGERWVFLCILLLIHTGLASSWILHAMSGIEALTWTIGATVVVGSVQGVAIMFRMLRRRRHQKISQVRAKPAPLP